MAIREVDGYTRSGGLISDGTALYAYLELSALYGGDAPHVLLFGGDTALCCDLLATGCGVTLVLPDENALHSVYQDTEVLLSPTPIEERLTLSIGCPGEDVTDLVESADIILCIDWLHHEPAPKSFLSQLLACGLVAVVDTTASQLIELMFGELRQRGDFCPEHAVCRDAAYAAGLVSGEDTYALWQNLKEPRFVQNYLVCPWCGPGCRTHKGREHWIATWHEGDRFPLAFGA